MPPFHLDDFKDMKRGDLIDHAFLNALLQAAKQDVALDNGVLQPGIMTLGRTRQTGLRHFIVNSLINIPVGSVFGISSDDSFPDEGVPKVTVGKHWTSVLPLAFCTNDATPIDENEQGFARILSPYDHAYLRFDGIAPAIGSHCGPKPETLKISSEHYGFVCVGPEEDGLVPVVVTGPVALVGVVTQYISEGLDKCLGQGEVKILYRIDGDTGSGSASCSGARDELISMNDPWLETVYNTCEPIDVGETVILKSVLGIGLMVVKRCKFASVSQFSKTGNQTVIAPGGGTQTDRIEFDTQESDEGGYVLHSRVALTTSGSDIGIQRPQPGKYMVGFAGILSVTRVRTGTINNVTNADPIVISTSNVHPFATGDHIYLYNIDGNLAANGFRHIDVTDSNNFDLVDQKGSGAYAGTGSADTAVLIPLRAGAGQITLRRKPSGGAFADYATGQIRFDFPKIHNNGTVVYPFNMNALPVTSEPGDQWDLVLTVLANEDITVSSTGDFDPAGNVRITWEYLER